MEREAFTEKKALIDTRKQEILSAIDEMEAKLLVEDEEQRQYQDAFEIKKYVLFCWGCLFHGFLF